MVWNWTAAGLGMDADFRSFGAEAAGEAAAEEGVQGYTAIYVFAFYPPSRACSDWFFQLSCGCLLHSDTKKGPDFSIRPIGDMLSLPSTSGQLGPKWLLYMKTLPIVSLG